MHKRGGNNLRESVLNSTCDLFNSGSGFICSGRFSITSNRFKKKKLCCSTILSKNFRLPNSIATHAIFAQKFDVHRRNKMVFMLFKYTCTFMDHLIKIIT